MITHTHPSEEVACECSTWTARYVSHAPRRSGVKVMELGDQLLTLQTLTHCYNLSGTSKAKCPLGSSGLSHSVCSPRTHQTAYPPVTAASPSPGRPTPRGPQQVLQAPTPPWSRSCSSSFLRPQCLQDCLTLHPGDRPGRGQKRSSVRQGVCKCEFEGEAVPQTQGHPAETSHLSPEGAQTQDPSPKCLSGPVSSLPQRVTHTQGDLFCPDLSSPFCATGPSAEHRG